MQATLANVLQVQFTSWHEREYKKRFGKVPPEEKLNEYFFLFKPTHLNAKFKAQMKIMDNYELSKQLLYKNYQFSSYEKFAEYCDEQTE